MLKQLLSGSEGLGTKGGVETDKCASTLLRRFGYKVSADEMENPVEERQQVSAAARHATTLSIISLVSLEGNPFPVKPAWIPTVDCVVTDC